METYQHDHSPHANNGAAYRTFWSATGGHREILLATPTASVPDHNFSSIAANVKMARSCDSTGYENV